MSPASHSLKDAESAKEGTEIFTVSERATLVSPLRYSLDSSSPSATEQAFAQSSHVSCVCLGDRFSIEAPTCVEWSASVGCLA